jgi:hypothetical protein
MDPITGALIGTGINAAANIGGRFLAGFSPQGAQPNLSSATQWALQSAPFNVGGGAVAATRGGVISSFAPLIIVAVLVWFLRK